MRDIDKPFCPVCQEDIKTHIFDYCDPVDCPNVEITGKREAHILNPWVINISGSNVGDTRGIVYFGNKVLSKEEDFEYWSDDEIRIILP